MLVTIIGHRRVCIARRKLPEGVWEILEFKDYLFAVNDAHNTISIGICPKDGTIHLAFDHHARELHYKVSKKRAALEPETVRWEVSIFGKVLSELEKDTPLVSITYPRFVQTSEEGLQLFYRRGGSSNGNRMVVDYNPEDGTWLNTRQIDSNIGNFQDSLGKSHSRGSYPNGYTYGPNGDLHTTWVWRESATEGANHDLMYAYSSDGGITWRNNSGNTLDEFINLNTPKITVVDIGRRFGLMNTHGQTIDSKNRIHTVMWHCTNETIAASVEPSLTQRWGSAEARRYHHYWRNEAGNWSHTELPIVAGNRAKLFVDKNDNLYLIFASKQASSTFTSEVYFNEGDLVIMAATTQSKWSDWGVIHIAKGPFMNEMLFDYYRWKASGILSVLVQESSEGHNPSALRVLDFKLN